ncbi:MAG TPA: class I SAM-dependent methyltransferase [Solirubrobacteraceae bacterium]|jgi:2-polyprenyl-3-methyl-5-hydroxy-6-metoxy-1,4-benzoquinol methylase|nr:class I SAM-dependent methyltransferase [Solirubrobacteraceae bacterium]
MGAGRYHEAIWSALPRSLEPEAFGLRRRFLLEHVQAGAHVLDLGCGAGEFSLELARAGARPLAVEVTPEPLRRLRERDASIEARLAEDEGALPVGDGAMDVVWAGEVIEHVRDTVGWLSEVRRVLRPGGLLLLSTPSHGRAALVARALLPRAFAETFDPRSDHLRFYRASSLGGLLEDFGFEDVRVHGVQGLPLLRRRLLASAQRGRW